MIVGERDLGDRLFLIERGLAHRITKVLGAPVLLAPLAADDMFGAIALLTDTHGRHATVMAVEPVQVLKRSPLPLLARQWSFPELRMDVVMSSGAMLNAKFLKRSGGPS